MTQPRTTNGRETPGHTNRNPRVIRGDLDASFSRLNLSEMDVKIGEINQWLAIFEVNLRFAVWCHSAVQEGVILIFGSSEDTFCEGGTIPPEEKFVSYQLQRASMDFL